MEYTKNRENIIFHQKLFFNCNACLELEFVIPMDRIFIYRMEMSSLEDLSSYSRKGGGVTGSNQDGWD